MRIIPGKKSSSLRTLALTMDLLTANGFSPSNTMLMGVSSDIKHGS